MTQKTKKLKRSVPRSPRRSFSVSLDGEGNYYLNFKAASLDCARRRISKIEKVFQDLTKSLSRIGVEIVDPDDKPIEESHFKNFSPTLQNFEDVFLKVRCPKCRTSDWFGLAELFKKRSCWNMCPLCKEYFQILPVKDLQKYFQKNCESCPDKIDCLMTMEAL